MDAYRGIIQYAFQSKDENILRSFKYIKENFPLDEEIKKEGLDVIYRVIKNKLSKKHIKYINIIGSSKREEGYIEFYCIFLGGFHDMGTTSLGKIEIEYDRVYLVNFVFLNTGEIIQYREQ